MRPGETDPKKKRVYFPLFDIDGLPASGEVDEGAVWAPAAGELQVNRDEVGYGDVVDLGAFSHRGNGFYRYEYDDTEIAGLVEGVILLRCKDLAAIRTQVIATPLELIATDSETPNINAMSGPFRAALNAAVTICVWVPTAVPADTDFIVQVRKPGGAAAGVALYDGTDLGAGVDWVGYSDLGAWLEIVVPDTYTDVAGIVTVNVILDEIPPINAQAAIEVGGAGGVGVTSTAATTLLLAPNTYQVIGFTVLDAEGRAVDADSTPTVSVTDYHTVTAYAPGVNSYGNGRYSVEVYAGVGFLELGWSGSIYVTATISGVVTTKAVTDYRIANVPEAGTANIPQQVLDAVAMRVDADLRVRVYLHDLVDTTKPMTTDDPPAGFDEWTVLHCPPGADAFIEEGSITHLGHGWFEIRDVTVVGGSGQPGSLIIHRVVEAGTPSVANIAYRVEYPSASTDDIRDAILDALLEDHAIVGSVADGIAIAAGLLQGNFFIDQTVNTNPNGQTAARMRVFRNAAAAAAASDGGVGEGEFATFNVETTYVGPNKITTHRVTRTV